MSTLCCELSGAVTAASRLCAPSGPPRTVSSPVLPPEASVISTSLRPDAAGISAPIMSSTSCFPPSLTSQLCDQSPLRSLMKLAATPAPYVHRA